MRKIQLAFLGLMICVELINLGGGINKELQCFSNKEKIVTTKGLTEKNIKIIEAEILIKTKFTSPSLKVVAKADNSISALYNYLKGKGYNLKTNDIYMGDYVTDYTYKWIDRKKIQVKRNHYLAGKNIIIAINDVENAKTITNEVEFNLINKNIFSDINVEYAFPELSSIKSELIAESTKNAGLTREQFAEDSQSKLEKIKTTSQDQITFIGQSYYSVEEDVNNAPKEPYLQKIRVVSTIASFFGKLDFNFSLII